MLKTSESVFSGNRGTYIASGRERQRRRESGVLCLRLDIDTPIRGYFYAFDIHILP